MPAVGLWQPHENEVAMGNGTPGELPQNHFGFLGYFPSQGGIPPKALLRLTKEIMSLPLMGNWLQAPLQEILKLRAPCPPVNWGESNSSHRHFRENDIYGGIQCYAHLFWQVSPFKLARVAKQSFLVAMLSFRVQSASWNHAQACIQVAVLRPVPCSEHLQEEGFDIIHCCLP